MTMKTRVKARAAAWLAAVAVSAAVTAQTVSDPTGLDIPQNVQLFGKLDPNIRKPTAIVNDTVLTGTDVDQRVAMIVSLNNNVQLSDEDRDRLKLQVLRQLIDETLQIQEAKRQDITVSQAEIDQSFGSVARRMNQTPTQFGAYLRTIGSSDRSLRRQIEGELAWQRVLRRRVTPFVNVGEEEVQAIIDRLKASQGLEEYHLKEIFLRATDDRQAEVAAAAQKMVAQMREGTPFEYFANNFSEASTRAVGGDLDWVRLAVLPEPLQQAATSMQVGQIAGPIPVPGGVSLLYLVDKRQVLTADPRDARLSLRQMSIKFAPNTSQTDATARATAFANAISKISGCGSVSQVAQSIGAEVVDNDSVRVRDLPPQLQDIMLKLQPGQATPPFGSPQEGVRTLVLCGRDDPKTAALPNAERIQSQLEEQRVNLRAQRMLRDLRRDAVVEYR
jgi:peptidyl-prolyl cis-trans isomerase SurA